MFTTVEELPIVACSLSLGEDRRASASDDRVDHTDQLRLRVPFAAFTDQPQPGDALLVGLTDAVPRCAVRLQFRCTIEGDRCRPRRPSAAVGGVRRHELARVRGRRGRHRWTEPRRFDRRARAAAALGAACSTASVPAGCEPALLLPIEGQPTYSAAPMIHGLVADTIGGHRRGRARRCHRARDAGRGGRCGRRVVPDGLRAGAAAPVTHCA